MPFTLTHGNGRVLCLAQVAVYADRNVPPSSLHAEPPDDANDGAADLADADDVPDDLDEERRCDVADMVLFDGGESVVSGAIATIHRVTA